MNLDALTDAVWERLLQKLPRALLIGEPPENYHKYNYVNKEPYECVILGLLSPSQLLHMPDDAVCDALLEGRPVYLWSPQPYQKQTFAPVLRRELQKAEQYLLSLGVQRMTDSASWITAQMVRSYLRDGRQIPEQCRMTPLAREILEGKET